MKNLHIPFDRAGNMMNWCFPDYPETADPFAKYAGEAAAVWRDNTPFHDTMRLVRLQRGRSAARFIFVSETTGKEYTMFGQWFVNALLKVGTSRGCITGKWGFSKRGANYSIEFLSPDDGVPLKEP